MAGLSRSYAGGADVFLCTDIAVGVLFRFPDCGRDCSLQQWVVSLLLVTEKLQLQICNRNFRIAVGSTFVVRVDGHDESRRLVNHQLPQDCVDILIGTVECGLVLWKGPLSSVQRTVTRG